MLTITVPAAEAWDEIKQVFVYVEETTLELEHSLVSLSKWESKWQKAFLSSKNKTEEEILDYIKCMTITPNVNENVYSYLTSNNIKAINDYIDAPMTATVFSDRNNKPSREIITAELIYYWLIALNIPFECQYWHLNRLLTLVKVCNIKNSPKKKMSKRDIMSRNAALNAARKKQLNTTG